MYIPSSKQITRELFEIVPSTTKKVLLTFPSILGWLMHAPLYMPARYFVFKYFKGTVHNDSVLIAVLFIAYPLYILSIVLVLFFITNCSCVFLLFLLLPFIAWSHIQLKDQLDRWSKSSKINVKPGFDSTAFRKGILRISNQKTNRGWLFQQLQ